MYATYQDIMNSQEVTSKWNKASIQVRKQALRALSQWHKDGQENSRLTVLSILTK